MIKEITVFAPATVANVACGFDILGFAVNSPGDEVVVRLSDIPGVKITKITGDGGQLPKEAKLNTAGISVIKFLETIKAKKGVEIELHKKMPLGSGLGSSAASAVASVYGANFLFGEPLSRKELLPFTMEGERVACGAAHADNVAPSLLGGFVLIRSYQPLDVVKIPVPKNLYATIVHPQIEIKTADARSILRKKINLKDAITQWGNTAGIIAGLMQEDYELIGRSLQDVIIEPVRSLLMPNFDVIKKAALKAGALGCSISGSGPSMFALSKGEEIATKVGIAMQKGFSDLEIENELYVSKINEEGPRRIEG